MFKRLILISATILFVAPAMAGAHEVRQTHYLATAKVYAPYEFLIGDWYTKLPEGNIVIHQQFSWGPGKASMNYMTYFNAPGREEHLHFGGLMAWNGKSRAVDYLFTVEPDSGVQEKGTFSVRPDGSVVREVHETRPDGKVVENRQIFRKLADGTISMDLLDRKPSGWASSLPAGQPIIMSPKRPE